ncbi:hypothetical protein KJQ78_07610, partial [Campylobacter lari]|uniref:CorA family divalent cation transporter n=1 Tax=Campylobacter lari TaxID=201 RepID=UPI0024E257D6
AGGVDSPVRAFASLGSSPLFIKQGKGAYISDIEDNTYINTARSEKINKNIYFLSIISAIFLPLNLIVGFFGMNTKNLFLSENEYGTYYILTTILVIFFILFLWYQFKDKKELDLDEFSVKKKKK